MRFVAVVAVKSICLCSPCNWHLVLGEKQRERGREREILQRHCKMSVVLFGGMSFYFYSYAYGPMAVTLLG